MAAFVSNGVVATFMLLFVFYVFASSFGFNSVLLLLLFSMLLLPPLFVFNVVAATAFVLNVVAAV